MKKIKLCKDCKYFVKGKAFNWAACTHRNNVKIELVEGNTEYLYSVNVLRDSDQRCGSVGNWFEVMQVEPKKKWWKIW